MQGWQANGQAGSPQGHNNVWSSPFGFPNGSNQFGGAQNWNPQIHNQNAYLAPQGNGAENNPFGSSPHQGHAAVANDHNGMAALNQGNFHNGHNHFALEASYAGSGQEDALDLNDFSADTWGQQGKADFAANIDNLSHSHTPDFTHQQFSYNGQANQLFNGNMSQFNEPQLLPQHGHQNSAQLQQRFEPVTQSYSPTPQGYVQSPQQHQAQPDRVYSQSPHSYQAQHTHQQNNQPFANPTPPPFQQSQPPVYQQQHKFAPQQISYTQPAVAPSFQPVAAKQMAEPEPVSQHNTQPAPQPQAIHQVKAIPAPARHIQPQPQLQQQAPQQHQQQPHQQQPPQQQLQLQPQLQPQPQPIAAAPVSQPGTPTIDPAAQPEQIPAKKRKRVTKKEPEPEQADSPSDFSVKKAEDGENLVFPSSTEEETMAMAQFKKRGAAAKKQFPHIPGTSFLVSSGTVKLPAPKSYDRLAPLVALASSSGNRILPELGPDLPCEIQGRFTDKYRPSTNFVGKPEDREMEAKHLIDQYQREMKVLGNRRPKYADYPFTFQEQLKADEAAKSKAQRKARKEEEEERKKPVRAETRPSDPVEGAVWDILGIVCIDPAATRTNDLIANTVKALGEFLIKLRTEMNRAKSEADQAAKEGKPASVIAEWTQKTELKKETFAKVCEAATKHGDEAVLENLGGHQKGILSLVNMLIGCIKAADINGSLSKTLLRFMSNISMEKKVADNVNFENVRKRLADKGDDEVKGLVRTIASRIKKETESSNGVDSKKTSSSASASKPAKPSAKAADGSPAKRARDDDTDSRTVKKIAVESSSNGVGGKTGVKPAAGSLQSKLGASRPRPTASASLAGKIRPPKPITREPAKPEPAKTEGSSSSTPMDIDKKPPTTVAPKPEPKVPAVKSAASSSSLSSSIASLLDSINTPKVDNQSTQSKDSNKRDTPETPEEKAKRLRKEARRKLRVTWKPETELVQVRIFHKEAAEDEDNMTKDAADDRSEGMMLKQRANMNEDEDDEDELPYQPWVEPILADLSRISQEYRDKSYVTRGGNVTFHTDEQKAIEEREKKELMVIYTDVSDIPPTPKSPPPELAVPDSEAKIGHLPQGDPKYDEIHKRWKETQQFGWEAAAYYARKRLDAKDDPATKLNSILGNLQPVAPAVTPEPYNMTPPTEHAQPVMPPAAEMQPVPAIPFDDKVNSILISDKVKNWRDANPFNSAAPQTQRRYDYPEAIQAAADKIEQAAEALRGLPYPATNPPAWLADDQERVREWWAGYQKDSVARAKKEAEERIRAEAQASAQQAVPQTQENQDAWAAYYQQQQQYAQYMALMQQMQGGQPQQPAQPAAQAPQVDDAQLQAILAQMSQQQQPAQAAPQGNTFGLNPQDSGYQQLMMLAQFQQQQQQPQPLTQQQQQQPPASETPSPNHAQEPSYNKPPHLQRQLVDYSDRDTRDEFDDHRGRDRNRGRNRDGEREGHEGREGRGGKQGKTRKGNAPGGATLPPHRPVNRALIGTKPCSFWQQGKCARGDKCTFRHDN